MSVRYGRTSTGRQVRILGRVEATAQYQARYVIGLRQDGSGRWRTTMLPCTEVDLINKEIR